jgi:hypothetical protein
LPEEAAAIRSSMVELAGNGGIGGGGQGWTSGVTLSASIYRIYRTPEEVEVDQM